MPKQTPISFWEIDKWLWRPIVLVVLWFALISGWVNIVQDVARYAHL